MHDLFSLLAVVSARHSHLCPRQVLGVRMGLTGSAFLESRTNLESRTVESRTSSGLLRNHRNLMVIAETDGCFSDALEVAAGVSVGRRTLRLEDYGKIAATFVDVRSGEAIRIVPRLDVRSRALDYAPDERRQYFVQLAAYQVMPDEELFSITPVMLSPSIETIISRAGVRTNCAACGEEIINEREILVDGVAYCRSCLGQSYYQIRVTAIPIPASFDFAANCSSPAQPGPAWYDVVNSPGVL